MGIFDFLKKKKTIETQEKVQTKGFKRKRIKENMKTYKAIDGSLLSGEGLKNLKEIAAQWYSAVKMKGVIIQSNGEKKVKYNNGKILEDWEAIKLLVKDMDKLNPNLFIMNLEALAFCEYDFGRIPRSPISIPIKLAEFWKGNINEDTLDDFFSMALEY